MTAVSTIATAAFREGNILPIGQPPTLLEQAEALDTFNRLLKGVFGVEMGEELTDWLVPQPQRTAPVAANYPQLPYPANADFLALSTPFANDATINIYPYPPKNSRIVFGGVTSTVYFPEAPDDGSRMSVVQGSGAGDSGAPGAVLTLNGNGRTIEGTNTKTYTDPVTARQWFYRADLGDWKALTTLGWTDDCPFPDEVDDFWVPALAVRLAPRFSKPVSQETAAALKAALPRFKARYRQAGTTTYGSGNISRSAQSCLTGGWFGL